MFDHIPTAGRCRHRTLLDALVPWVVWAAAVVLTVLWARPLVGALASRVSSWARGWM